MGDFSKNFHFEEMRKIYKLPYIYFGIYFGLLIIILGIVFSIAVIQHNPTISTITPSQSILTRGWIFFQNKYGGVEPAAILGERYELWLTPVQVVDRDEIYENLKGILKISFNEFNEYFNKKGISHLLIKNVTQEDFNYYKEVKKTYALSGIKLQKKPIRLYPNKELGSHLLGFAAPDVSTEILRGAYGLERSYEHILRQGNSSGASFTQIFKNITLKQNKEKKNNFENNTPQGSLVTTIDINVQKKLEEVIISMHKNHNSKLSGGIVINPKTGAIRAMAGYPYFDPNNYIDVTDYNVYRNPNIENTFELGSVLKVFTFGIGLEKGSFTAQTTYNDKGFIKIEASTIRNFDGKGRGPETTYQTVIQESLNTGAIEMMKSIGALSYKNFLASFRIGDQTGIDLPNEAYDNINNLNTKRFIEYATASYGHGIALSPISAVRLFAPFANGGFRIVPYVGEYILTDQGEIHELHNKDFLKEQLLRKETVDAVNDTLVKAFDYSAIGQLYGKKHYSISAKTGTAVTYKNGKIDTEKVFDTYVAWFPAKNPHSLIFFYTENPENGLIASRVFGEPFGKLSSFLIDYYQITPDR
ncbi:MAG: penicillin-binding transpeptidase domain-containing protein [Alphaproteobacteria bacterium]|nr:penicillin-binding transpeptidase domain-containing protein [Alphaproteobacteria bacterium]